MNNLRECLDPFCDEYQSSEMGRKIEILREVQEKMPLEQAVREYKEDYKHRTEPANPLSVLPNGLVKIIEHLLLENKQLQCKHEFELAAWAENSPAALACVKCGKFVLEDEVENG
ncbi:MAG: hypothetical protein FWC26_01330 [Fibromonadales bacterium]|nr:hypothetical protein [Fibromonadales bacterium]